MKISLRRIFILLPVTVLMCIQSGSVWGQTLNCPLEQITMQSDTAETSEYLTATPSQAVPSHASFFQATPSAAAPAETLSETDGEINTVTVLFVVSAAVSQTDVAFDETELAAWIAAHKDTGSIVKLGTNISITEAIEPLDETVILWRSDDEGKTWRNAHDTVLNCSENGTLVMFFYGELEHPVWLQLEVKDIAKSNIAVLFENDIVSTGALGGDRTGTDRKEQTRTGSENQSGGSQSTDESQNKKTIDNSSFEEALQPSESAVADSAGLTESPALSSNWTLPKLSAESSQIKSGANPPETETAPTSENIASNKKNAAFENKITTLINKITAPINKITAYESINSTNEDSIPVKPDPESETSLPSKSPHHPLRSTADMLPATDSQQSAPAPADTDTAILILLFGVVLTAALLSLNLCIIKRRSASKEV